MEEIHVSNYQKALTLLESLPKNNDGTTSLTFTHNKVSYSYHFLPRSAPDDHFYSYWSDRPDIKYIPHSFVSQVEDFVYAIFSWGASGSEEALGKIIQNVLGQYLTKNLPRISVKPKIQIDPETKKMRLVDDTIKFFTDILGDSISQKYFTTPDERKLDAFLKDFKNLLPDNHLLKNYSSAVQSLFFCVYKSDLAYYDTPKADSYNSLPKPVREWITQSQLSQPGTLEQKAQEIQSSSRLKKSSTRGNLQHASPFENTGEIEPNNPLFTERLSKESSYSSDMETGNESTNSSLDRPPTDSLPRTNSSKGSSFTDLLTRQNSLDSLNNSKRGSTQW